MQVYFDARLHAEAQHMAREHPWDKSLSNPSNRYMDFKGVQPSVIAAHLEDLQPISDSVAAKAVVEFLVWANSPGSIYETNDLGLRPIGRNQTPAISPLQCELHGRLSLFFRQLDRNTDAKLMTFGRLFEAQLKSVDPGFSDACVGWNLWPHFFTPLLDAGLPEWEAEGDTIQLNLWAWGNDAEETHTNFARALKNVRVALET